MCDIQAVLAIGGLGPMELVLIVLVILILFGAKRLPELAKGLGRGIREFRGALSDTSDQIKKSMDAPDSNQKSTTSSNSGDQNKSN